MAKFKVGDKVFCRGFGSKPMTVKEVIEISPSQVDYILAGNPNVRHGEYDLRAANSRCVNSTRPIVQMALNRTACNYTLDWKNAGNVKIGDLVHGDAHYGVPGIHGKVVKIDYDNVTVDFGSHGVREMPIAYAIPVKNSSAPADGVVKNAYSVDMSIRDLDKAIVAAGDAASGVNQHSDIVQKIEAARKILLEARKMMKAIS